MEKRNVFRVILLSILVSYTVCEVEDEPNHLFPESTQEVTGFKKLSAKHADIPLRSRQHNFPVQTSTITDPFSSDDERIGSLVMDGRVLPLASKDAQKSIKIRNVSTIGKIKFFMRRSARRHNVLKSTHGTGMPSSASILKDSKDIEAFTFQKTQPSSTTGLQYKTKITAPFKLVNLPTEETVIPSVDKADVETDWLSKEGNTTEQDDQKSSHNDGKEENSLPHGEPKVTGHEGSTRHAGTSAMPQHKMAVHPGVKASSGLRWKAAYDHVKLDDSKKGKHFKNKKKKSHSEDDEPLDSSSPAATVAGILAGLLMVLIIFTGVLRLWRISNKRWRRSTCREFASDFPSTGSCSEELSEEEIIFDKSATQRNKGSSKNASPRTTTEASLGTSQSATSSYQSPDYPTLEQKIWTLTDTSRSTPLMDIPNVNSTPRAEVWTSKEIPESKSQESLFSSMSLSDSRNVKPTETSPSVSWISESLISQASDTEVCDSELEIDIETSSLAPFFDLTDKTVSCFASFTTQPTPAPSTSSEPTTLGSSVSPHPSTPSFSLLPTPSDESTPSMTVASASTISSTESCKTPVAVRNEVVITMDANDENIIYPSDKSEVLSAVKDAGKASNKSGVVTSMGLDDQEESESSSGEVIHTNQESEMKNATAGDTIIDIMGSDNDNGETSAINETSNQGVTRPEEAEKAKVKREVRREDASTSPLDTGASTSSNSKIRVLNHKDYKTWKELQKDIKMKKAQGLKPHDVLPGLQVIRDIYNLPRIPVDSEGGCLCYYCEKHIKRAQREKFFKIPSKLISFKSKSSAKESPSDSQSSSKSSAAKIRVLNHKDYKTWKELQKDIKMKKAQGIKPRDVLPGLQVIRDIYSLPRIPVDSEGGCLCYYCEKHIKRAQRKKFFKLPRLHR